MDCKIKIYITNCITLLTLICLISTTSCTTIPKPICPNKETINSIKTVAISVSCSDVGVKYFRESGWSGTTHIVSAIGIIPAIIAASAEASTEKSQDQKLVEQLPKTISREYVSMVLGNEFLSKLQEANIFRTIEYTDTCNRDSRNNLSSKNYDALINLNIKELSLRGYSGGVVRLCANVKGELITLKNGNVEWKEQEAITSDNAYQLDYYINQESENLKNAIDQILKKIAEKLANDLIYAN